MTVEENVRIVEQADDAFNAQDWDQFINLHAESIVVNGPNLNEPIKGREALREYVNRFFTAFPDMTTKRERMFGQGNWVISEEIAAGTNTGPMASPTGEETPPTNKPVQFNQAVVFQVENGLIQQVHLYFDQLGIMAQLGLVPSE